MRVKKFMVISFTIVAFIAVMTIVFFGFKENKVETPIGKGGSYTIMSTVNLQGKEYKINVNDPVERDYENGQKLYKAADGTYIAWAAISYSEWETYNRDSNGDSYSTGIQKDYAYKWMVVSEDWDAHITSEISNKNSRFIQAETSLSDKK